MRHLNVPMRVWLLNKKTCIYTDNLHKYTPLYCS